ncbi:MAG: hypothetical protein WD467_03875 [Candidatus Saccharimonadales bacterium]
MSGICEERPLQATLDSAQELVEHYPEDVHPTQEQSLGGIAVTASSLERVAKRLNCPGPITKDQLDCPLRDSALGARNYGLGKWDLQVDLNEDRPGYHG